MSNETAPELSKLREDFDEFKKQTETQLKQLSDYVGQQFFGLKERVAALEKEAKQRAEVEASPSAH